MGRSGASVLPSRQQLLLGEALPLPLLLLLLLQVAEAPPGPVSAERSLVWGPGLEAELTMPVRYFYIQAASAAGQNLTRSPPGRTQFKVGIKALSPKEVIRIHIPNLMDRNDGSFLIQYRMYGSVNEGLKIEVLYGNEHVAQSPYILKGPVKINAGPYTLSST